MKCEAPCTCVIVDMSSTEQTPVLVFLAAFPSLHAVESFSELVAFVTDSVLQGDAGAMSKSTCLQVSVDPSDFLETFKFRSVGSNWGPLVRVVFGGRHDGLLKFVTVFSKVLEWFGGAYLHFWG